MKHPKMEIYSQNLPSTNMLLAACKYHQYIAMLYPDLDIWYNHRHTLHLQESNISSKMFAYNVSAQKSYHPTVFVYENINFWLYNPGFRVLNNSCIIVLSTLLL